MTSPYYQPSGRVSPAAIPVALLCSVAVLPAAYAYAWLTLRAPFVLNFFIAFGYSFLIGVIVKFIATRGKVRNVRWMSRAGTALALLAWYCQWAAWIALTTPARAGQPVADAVTATFGHMVMHPWCMVSVAIGVSKTGTIDIEGWPVAGGVLIAVWLIELCLHLSVPPVMGRMCADEPFCEASNTWAKKNPVPRRFAFIDAPSVIKKVLEADPRQLLSLLAPWTEDTPHYAEVVVYGAGGAESYVSITNIVVKSQGKGEPKTEQQPVLEFLRLPDMAADALLRHLTEQSPRASNDCDSAELPTPAELAPALEYLQAEQYEAAVEAAMPHLASEKSSLRTDANRLCALASSRLGRWTDAVGYWQSLIDDERTAHNALQLATSSVMAGDLPSGETWIKEARRLNATSAELPGLLILTNFVTALSQSGQSAAAMPYLDQIRQVYVDLGATDPTLLYVNRIPAFSAFLGSSAPVVRAALNPEQGRGWYTAMRPHLDDRGNAELNEWLESEFGTI